MDPTHAPIPGVPDTVESQPQQDPQPPLAQPAVSQPTFEPSYAANLGAGEEVPSASAYRHHSGYSSDSHAHYSSRPVDYNSAPDFQSPDAEPSRSNAPPLTQQPQPPTLSRPDSGLSGGQGSAQTAQDVSQKQPAQQSKNSVVIKVGMVGDAQIGKTSLMVKYVEGSWDEDYIQTLGMLVVPRSRPMAVS